jgi:transcriptional regulator with GAF, ATPase, and Fis domain
MMLAPMATKPTPKTSTRTPQARPRRNPEPERARSRLVEIGDDAMRKALLAELRRADWNLSTAAEALGMTSAANVLRSIRRLGLVEEYDAAKASGKIRPGGR